MSRAAGGFGGGHTCLGTCLGSSLALVPKFMGLGSVVGIPAYCLGTCLAQAPTFMGLGFVGIPGHGHLPSALLAHGSVHPSCTAVGTANASLCPSLTTHPLARV